MLAMLLALGTLASSANAFSLRSPQVGFNFGPLQTFFNGFESINVASQQLDAQSWGVTISGNADFTILLKQPSPQATIGIYNALVGSPALYQVFPLAATTGWAATCHFGTGAQAGYLTVSLYDNLGVFQGQTIYTGVDSQHFGFYLQDGYGTFYSQDYRNPGGAPQMVSYAGFVYPTDLYEAFEGAPYGPGSTFTTAVLDLESVLPKVVPTHAKSWGSLKSDFR